MSTDAAVQSLSRDRHAENHPDLRGDAHGGKADWNLKLEMRWPPLYLSSLKSHANVWLSTNRVSIRRDATQAQGPTVPIRRWPWTGSDKCAYLIWIEWDKTTPEAQYETDDPVQWRLSLIRIHSLDPGAFNDNSHRYLQVFDPRVSTPTNPAGDPQPVASDAWQNGTLIYSHLFYTVDDTTDNLAFNLSFGDTNLVSGSHQWERYECRKRWDWSRERSWRHQQSIRTSVESQLNCALSPREFIYLACVRRLAPISLSSRRIHCWSLARLASPHLLSIQSLRRISDKQRLR